MKRSARFGAPLAVGLAVLTAAQAAAEPGEAVVLIRCTLSGGEAKATGFVWPEPGFVVTALHAVAGCSEIDVWSEATGGLSLATIQRVDLDSDLALLELDDDLGLAAARSSEVPPDTLADFVTFGYPLAAEQMIRLRVEFGGGLSSDVVTLGGAFAHEELDDLFRTQDYPTRDTRILRVNTTIQPGHSGAPIFDAEGRVVAIADGGLLGGWRTINWSIPAYLYLPDLLASEDLPPAEPSGQAQLFAQVQPQEAAVVEFAPMDAAASTDQADGGVLNLVRQVSLRDVADWLESAEITDGLYLVGEIASYLESEAAFEAIGYNIYEDTSSGATIGVPWGFDLVWDPDLEAAVAANEPGTVVYAAALGLADSFDDAVSTRLDRFAAQVSEDVEWSDDVEIAYDEIDPAMETAAFLAVLEGVESSLGLDVQMSLGLHVDGPVYLGAAVGFMADPETATLEDDLVDYLQTTLGAWYLSDFAVR